MTTGTDEPAELGDETSTASGAFESDSSSRALQAAFEGWLAFSDIVSDTDPDLAGLMVAAAHVARVAVEDEIPSLFRGLGEVLGLSQSALDGFGETLRAESSIFTREAMADLLNAGSEDLLKELSNADQEDPWLMADRMIAKFLDSNLIKDSAWKYDEERKRIAALPNAAAYRWRAVCSLELPSTLEKGHMPIQCTRHARYPFGTRLDAVELTYLPTTRSGLSTWVRGNSVGHETTGYRKSIDVHYPQGFWGAIDESTAGWAYGLSLVEGPRSVLVHKVVSLFQGKQGAIDGVVAAGVEASKDRFIEVLNWANIPLAVGHPLLPLIKSAVTTLIKFLTTVVVKALSERVLTTWTVWHSVVMGSHGVPISVFMLERPDGLSPELSRLDKNGDKPVPDNNYQYNPSLESRARFMIGRSVIEDLAFDNDYFGLVATSGQPLAWKEPLETNSGFRVLVPHLDRQLTSNRESRDILAEGGSHPNKVLARKSKSVYVSALRADVYLHDTRGPSRQTI
jgi:hypothetical protein